jgi:hypothetical protein
VEVGDDGETTAGRQHDPHWTETPANSEEEAMSEEKNNTKMSAAGSGNAADETKQKLSEDARGLGPRQAGRFAIGLVDEFVGEGGVEVPEFATKYELLVHPFARRRGSRRVHQISRGPVWIGETTRRR